MKLDELGIGQKIYWTRIIPKLNIYDLYELKVRRVADTWFVAVDKRTKHSYIFNDRDLDKIIFVDRNEALEIVKEKELEE